MTQFSQSEQKSTVKEAANSLTSPQMNGSQNIAQEIVTVKVVKDEKPKVNGEIPFVEEDRMEEQILEAADTTSAKKEAEEEPFEKEESAEQEPQAKRARISETPESGVDGEEPQSVRRSGRERKAVQREGFVTSPREGSAEEVGEELKIIAGRGVRLADIPNFIANYSGIKNSNPCIRKLYKALFNVTGRPQARRSEILQWSGIPEDTGAEGLASALTTHCTLPELSVIGRTFLGLTTGAGGKVTKQAWCDAVTEILANPQPNSIQLAVSGPTESGRGSGGKARGSTGYQLWCTESREALKAQNRDMPHKQFLKVLSDAWRNLSDEERQKYLNASNAKKASKPARRGKRRGRKESEEEEEEIDYEDDDDDEIEGQTLEEVETLGAVEIAQGEDAHVSA